MDKEHIFLTQAGKEYGQLFGQNGGAGPCKENHWVVGGIYGDRP